MVSAVTAGCKAVLDDGSVPSLTFRVQRVQRRVTPATHKFSPKVHKQNVESCLHLNIYILPAKADSQGGTYRGYGLVFTVANSTVLASLLAPQHRVMLCRC